MHRRAGVRPGQGVGDRRRRAPEGQVIDRCESFLLGRGRDFLRRALESTLQAQAETLEKTGHRPACPCGAVGRHKGNASRTVMTALGPWPSGGPTSPAGPAARGCLRRSAPRPGRLPHAPGDAADLPARGAELLRRRRAPPGRVLRLEGQRRDHPPGLPGGADSGRRLPSRSSPAPAESFAAAAGDVEFQVDAAKVNTTGGWRDMKVGIFARRERGEPATPAEWDERDAAAADDAGGLRGDRGDRRLRPALGGVGDPAGDRGSERRSPSWATAPNGSGTRRRGSSAAAIRCWTSTTPPSRSPTRARRSSASGRRRGGLAGSGPRAAAVRRLGRAVRPHRGDARGGPRTGRACGVGRL